MTLVIRKDQMSALNKAIARRFIEQTADDLRSQFPELLKNLTDDEVRAFVLEQMEAANCLGLSQENDVRNYIVFVTPYNGKIDHLPWAKPYLDQAPWDAPTQTLKMMQQESELTHST